MILPLIFDKLMMYLISSEPLEKYKHCISLIVVQWGEKEGTKEWNGLQETENTKRMVASAQNLLVIALNLLEPKAFT